MTEKDMIKMAKIGIVAGFILLFIALNNGYYEKLEKRAGKVISIEKEGLFYNYRIMENNIIVCRGFKFQVRENQTINYDTTPGKCFIWDLETTK